MLLVGQLGDLQIHSVKLLLTMLLVGVLFLDGLLALLLLGLLIALMAQLLKALADLLVELHEGRRRRAAQAGPGTEPEGPGHARAIRQPGEPIFPGR